MKKVTSWGSWLFAEKIGDIDGYTIRPSYIGINSKPLQGSLRSNGYWNVIRVLLPFLKFLRTANEPQSHGGLVQMIFLFKQVIFRFHR